MIFDAARQGTGTLEWAEFNENIARGCEHNCKYCYAATNAKRFKLRDRAEWQREELTKRAFVTSYPKRDGVIMFPSAHDITPFNVQAYIRVAKLMLQAGNQLLIVSKPHLAVITQLCDELAAHKDAILFRFTIGTTDDAIAAHWEPGAPLPGERIKALELAFLSGFRTSISAEPLLGGLETAQVLLDAVRPFVTDTVWIGKMNKIRARVDMSDPLTAQYVQDIERLQSDAEVLRMFDALDGDPLIRWKDSVTEVVARHLIKNPDHFCDFCKRPLIDGIFARIVKDDGSHVDCCDNCFDAYGVNRDISIWVNQNLGELWLSKPMKMLDKYWTIGNPVLESA